MRPVPVKPDATARFRCAPSSGRGPASPSPRGRFTVGSQTGQGPPPGSFTGDQVAAAARPTVRSGAVGLHGVAAKPAPEEGHLTAFPLVPWGVCQRAAATGLGRGVSARSDDEPSSPGRCRRNPAPGRAPTLQQEICSLPLSWQRLWLPPGRPPLLPCLLILTTPLCSLVSGFLLAFAIVVMPGMKTLSDHDFLQAFQAIDHVIQGNQPVFLVVWLGSGFWA